MRDRPALLAILAVLGTAAVAYNVYVYSSLWSGPKGTGRTSPDAGPAAEPGHESAPAPEFPPHARVISRTSLDGLLAALPPTRRSPFAFAEPAADGSGAAGRPFALQGTLVGSRKIAWINQIALAEGEQIEGHEVKRIEPGHVILQRGALKIELRSSP